MTSPASRHHAPSTSVLVRFALGTAVAALAPLSSLHAQVTVHNDNASFLANSYYPGAAGTATGLWIPNWSDGLYELPNGTVFVNSGYDEGHRDAAIYTSAGLDTNAVNSGKNGRAAQGSNGPGVATFADTHGYGRTAGSAVTSDGTYVYLGSKQTGQNFPANPAEYPVSNCDAWQTARIYDLKGNIITNTALENTNGYDGSMIIVSKTQANAPPNYQGAWKSGTYSQYQSVLYNAGYWQETAAAGDSGAPGSDSNWAQYSCNSATKMKDGSSISYKTISNTLMGMAMLNNLLYVVDETITPGAGPSGGDLVKNTLRVFNPSTLAEVSSAEVDLGTTGVVTAMTSRASDNTLWLTVANNGYFGSPVTTTPTVLKVTAPSGSTPTVLDLKVTGLSEPAAIFFDISGKLMIGDNGKHQQVIYYTVNATSLTEAGTFGVTGGIGGTPNTAGIGQSAYNKFQGITGIGMDSSGNLVVVCNNVGKYHLYPANTDPRIPSTTARQTELLGTLVRFFASTGSGFNYNLTSQFQNSAFVTTADVDTSNETQLYTSTGGFNFAYPAAGATATWSQFANTLDTVNYPLDPRVWLDAGTPVMRRLNNNGTSQLFMYTFSQYPGMVDIFRFDGSVAVPAAMITYEDSSSFPPNHPAAVQGDSKDPWTWTDPDGTGNFTTASFSPQGTVNTFKNSSNGHAGGWWVEPNTGNIWVTNTGLNDQGNAIFEFPLKGFTAKGAPEYGTWDDAAAFKIPALSASHPDPTPFPLTDLEKAQFSAKCPPQPKPTCGDLCGVQRAIYDRASDVMILSGYTASDVALGLRCTGDGAGPQVAGATIIRYNTWSTTPTVAWKQAIPYVTTTGINSYLAVGYPETLEFAFGNTGNPGGWIFVGYSFDDLDENASPSNNNTGYTGTILALSTGTGLAPNGTAPGTDRTQAILRSQTAVGNPGGATNAAVIDTPFGIRSHLRSSGQYDLFTEDDTYGKIIVLSDVVH